MTKIRQKKSLLFVHLLILDLKQIRCMYFDIRLIIWIFGEMIRFHKKDIIQESFVLRRKGDPRADWFLPWNNFWEYLSLILSFYHLLTMPFFRIQRFLLIFATNLFRLFHHLFREHLFWLCLLSMICIHLWIITAAFDQFLRRQSDVSCFNVVA